MFRRLIVVVLGALVLAPTSAAYAPSVSQPSPTQERGSPINDQGSNYNYRSYITLITPDVPGLSLQVLEFADRLVLTNHTGATIMVDGYEGEPYARVLADGTVEVNTRSPAYYLNQNFYGDVTVPASASASAAPRWTVLDRTGQFEWHDHRIHWMSPIPPPQVKDKGRRAKIFDWRVPIQVGSHSGTVDGQLFWVPEEGTKAPAGAIVALLAIVLLGLGLMLVVRRRRWPISDRSGAPPPDACGGGAGPEPGEPSREAW
jgi:hypothetical protein